MSTRIFLIRHGDTGATQEDRFTGRRDIPLTEEGQMHAQELGTRLEGFPISAVYASSMQRAHATAQAIAALHSLDVVKVDALCEIAHGHWDGMTFGEIQTQYPDELAAYERDPFGFTPEGGESAQATLDRALPALLEIVRAHPNQQVAVVAHKGTNCLLIGHLLGLDKMGYRTMLAQRPACVNVLDFLSETQVTLSLLNDVSHYIIGAPPHTPYVV